MAVQVMAVTKYGRHMARVTYTASFEQYRVTFYGMVGGVYLPLSSTHVDTAEEAHSSTATLFSDYYPEYVA